MQQNTQWRVTLVLCRLFKILPHSMALSLGAFLAQLVWFFSKKRVDQSEARCVKALGIGPTLARSVVLNSYRNHGRSIAEFVRLPKMKGSIGRFVRVSGEDNLKRAFSKNRGIVILSGHIGNWEVAAAWLASKGYPIGAIGAEQRDPRFTDLILSIRESCGIKGIGKGFSLKAAFKCLKKGNLLAVLLDQDAKERGIVLPFLGLPASTPYGPIKIASRTGSSIVPLLCVRRGSSSFFEIRILPEIEIPLRDLSEEEIRCKTLMCNNILSDWISNYPEQWMWLYPRWSSTLGDK